MPDASAAGCALTRGEPLAEYGIDLDLPPPAAASRHPWQIVIETPHASEPLASDRIVVTAPDGELTVLPAVRWRERAPALVQSLLLEAFDACACIAAAARDGGVLRGDFVLTGELRRFELRDEDSEPPVATVDLTLTLVRRSDGQVQATRRFQHLRTGRGPRCALGNPRAGPGAEHGRGGGASMGPRRDGRGQPGTRLR